MDSVDKLFRYIGDFHGVTPIRGVGLGGHQREYGGDKVNAELRAELEASLEDKRRESLKMLRTYGSDGNVVGGGDSGTLDVRA